MKVVEVGTTLIIAVLVFYSIILHEVSHALVSHWLGDDTAKRMNRLSLNPLKHIDWFGTVLLPLILLITHAGIIFGYAKPVPLNPYNYRNFKRDVGLTALAGPVTNFLIAIVFALIFQLAQSNYLIQSISLNMVYLNLFLTFLNLIPLPPLDGSKVLGMVLSDEAYFRWTAQERYGMMFLMILVAASFFFRVSILFDIIGIPVKFIMRLLNLPI
jgi:Zn-dependent protease